MAINNEQHDELTALSSIYEEAVFFNLDQFPFSGHIIVDVDLDRKFSVGNNSNNYNIEYLPPITLYVQLPSCYPNVIPHFQVKCIWLNTNQISTLNEILAKRFQNGFVVLYDWMTIIKEELLQLLEIKNKIVLNNEQLQEILSFNENKINKRFSSSYFDCNICFGSIIGDNCIQFYICKHIFCKPCLSKFLIFHITEGSLILVKCPSYKCNNEIPMNLIKELVPPDIFERYDSLLLKSSLELMPDVMYCPRSACNSIVIVDKELGLGSCPSCQHSFCIRCKQTYHGIQKCNIKSGQLKDIVAKYIAGSFDEKSQIELTYGKKLMENMVEDFENNSWLQSNTKTCPSCKANIEKFDGCNKMVCTKCEAYFCWLCVRPIAGYGHFNDANSTCFQKLFDTS